MTDEQPRRAPSSEDVALALRHCWQPVARLEDLEDGPQRAVLLGEALAVFLTESGEPAVVADRCAHRGASLSMGKVAGDSDPVPLPRLGVGGRRCLHPDPLAGRSESDPAARPDPGLSRAASSGGWSGPTLEEPLASLPDAAVVRRGGVDVGSRHAVRAAGRLRDDDRELPRRRPFRLRPPGHPGRDAGGDRAARCPRANGLEVTLRRKMEWGDGAERGLGLAARNATTTRSRPTSPRRGCSPTTASAACSTPHARSAQPSRRTTGSRAGLENFDEERLEKVIAYDAGIYAEDVPIISAIEPPELPLDPERRRQHARRSVHARLPGGVRASSSNRALAERSTRAGAATG